MTHHWRRWGSGLLGGPVFLFLLAFGSRHATSNSVEFEVPFTYGSAGVGEEAVQGILVLPANQAEVVVATALLDALQGLRLSVVSPPLGPGVALPPGKEWSTDTVEVDPSVIEAHNQANPSLALPRDRVYGLQYRGSYTIARHDQGKSLAFSIHAVLQQRGAAASQLRPYPRQYSGAFFIGSLKKSIQEKLIEAAKPK